MKEVLKRNIKGWVFSIIIAFFIVFLLKTFVGMPTTVKGKSMKDTLDPEDKLFVSTLIRITKKVPNRGDIITFEAPSVDTVDNVSLINPKARNQHIN